jgi:hypothetical protein
VAFHRLDESLLAQRPGPKGTTPDAGGQHLPTEVAMFLTAAAVEGRESRLHVHRCDRFTALPQGPEQLEQGAGPFNLSWAATQMEIQTAQAKGAAGESFDAAQIDLCRSSQG